MQPPAVNAGGSPADGTESAADGGSPRTPAPGQQPASKPASGRKTRSKLSSSPALDASPESMLKLAEANAQLRVKLKKALRLKVASAAAAAHASPAKRSHTGDPHRQTQSSTPAGDDVKSRLLALKRGSADRASTKKKKKAKCWSKTNVEAPSGPLSVQIAEGVSLETVLEVAVEFVPQLPPRDRLWVTLTPAAGNAQPATLYKRLAELFVGHSKEEWAEAGSKLGIPAPTAATAGYVLLYVAHMIRESGRTPDNFDSRLFEATSSPVRTRVELRTPLGGPKGNSDKGDKAGRKKLDFGAMTPDGVGADDGVGDMSPAKVTYLRKVLAEAEKVGNFEEALRISRILLGSASTSVPPPTPDILPPAGDQAPRVPPPATPTETGQNAIMLKMMEMMQAMVGKAPSKPDEDEIIKHAVPIPGQAVTGDSLYQKGELPDPILQLLRKYKYLCYLTIYHNSSAAALVGRASKKSITVGKGTSIRINADAELEDASSKSICEMSYLQWDTAARMVEDAMRKERPAEFGPFLVHQARVRDYRRNYRVNRPHGFLEYDMMVRKLAAVAQAGANPRPFDWAAECNMIFRQCFAGFSPGRCESCGSVRHYTDECKPGLLEKETASRRLGGYGDGGGGESRPGEDGDRSTKKSKRERQRLAKERAAASSPGGTNPRDACNGWNNGDCSRQNCRFKHNVCRTCGGSHRWSDPSCPKFVGADRIKQAQDRFVLQRAERGEGG